MKYQLAQLNKMSEINVKLKNLSIYLIKLLHFCVTAIGDDNKLNESVKNNF
jgi:hypothetical protein